MPPDPAKEADFIGRINCSRRSPEHTFIPSASNDIEIGAAHSKCHDFGSWPVTIQVVGPIQGIQVVGSPWASPTTWKSRPPEPPSGVIDQKFARTDD